MARTPDPLRLHAAALTGAGFRTALWDEADALAELRTIADRHPDLAAQACADAAQHWDIRGASGTDDVRRTEAAAAHLRKLAYLIAGHDVEPSPREVPLGGHTIPTLKWDA